MNDEQIMMNTTHTLTITRPDDWHLHLRDGAALAAREKDRIHRIPWQEAGALSFAVYLVHPVYVNLLYKFVKITPFTVLEQCGVQSVAAGQAVLILLLVAICLVVLALATATAWVLRKIPVLRKYVL